MAVTDRAARAGERTDGTFRWPPRDLAGFFGWFFSLLGGLLASGNARAVDLPEDKAEALFHSYIGGGVDAYGPAFLVRKSILDKVSLTGTYYMDAVSNASIDVVTTASPYHEVRNEFGLSADYVYRDAQITVGAMTSHEPDYVANTGNIDVTQEVFGGMTTVAFGFTRGSDKVGKKNSPEFSDTARHWQYRLGATQILTPRWLMSANFEALNDDGYLGSPYRLARVFGAAVPERNPRTRSGRAVQLRLVGDLGSRDAMHVAYRYFRDTWDIKAHTAEIGYSRYFGEKWLADAFLRYYTQTHALFYSDNAMTETVYVSRNRQLSTFDDTGIGGKLSYGLRHVPGSYDLKLNGTYEYTRFKFKDFTDIRTGSLYGYSANVIQLYLSATY
ncbi:MAG TPA: DUF3570 domain-containing protein [Caldimonas sp.]